MKNNSVLLFIVLYAFVINAYATTLALPKESTVPGGLAIISINTKEKPDA